MTRTNAITKQSNAADLDVTIRRATDGDALVLRRLAALDCRRPLAGATLVAEVGGEIVAARSLETGDVAADPFRHTADLVTLLGARACHLLGVETAPAQRLGLVSRARLLGSDAR